MNKLATILLALFVTLPCYGQRAVFFGQNATAAGGGGPSAFAYVASSVTACFQGSNSNKCAYATHTSPVAGHLRLITSFWADSGTQTVTVTSSNGDAWVSITPGKVAGTGALAGFSFQRFRVFSSAGSADTITVQVNTGTSSPMGWEATEYSYTGSISAFDGTPVLTNVASVASVGTTSSVTIVNSSDLLWADCPGTVNTCSAGAGWTARNDASGTCNFNGSVCGATNQNMNALSGMLIEDKVGVTAGTYTATFGTTGATDASVLGLLAL